jgi:hypothetical protein
MATITVSSVVGTQHDRVNKISDSKVSLCSGIMKYTHRKNGSGPELCNCSNSESELKVHRVVLKTC